ncbi:hypothetical protein AL705_03450 [Lawsonella clevelandensis]|uniref:Uncharacterized protein n=1 Tax=Lawsonella clevelandensis TaxID=1528099 RepID=A0A0M4LZ13_9ACTN|nr:hypothetical protein AL705_03450 [Lawsonella clevelandensis]
MLAAPAMNSAMPAGPTRPPPPTARKAPADPSAPPPSSTKTTRSRRPPRKVSPNSLSSPLPSVPSGSTSTPRTSLWFLRTTNM